MNQPEHELAKKIVQHLDYGVDQLEPRARTRLFAARQSALSHYREQPVAVTGLAWAGQVVARITDHRYASTRQLAAISLLVVALAGIAYWQSNGVTNEATDIDTGLLTDELPINAYLDKGFDSWLKRSSR
ncbi:MAG TPA: DUF3619 family protein [Burkholderiales bacterium]|nr:DUF3619 family protein [Burkholderiales bacterium]